ncbi:DsbA family oxidoreductase [Dasania sp. GY-MA-18]|uniref:DsbA family oxidoreductase n=1 Tax=Dasania phycosphaerae TaxID=2950436 RepID=A0A9J6RMQ5_9GAMM|nr:MULTISPECIES: DsbA family oxidoreductase [Dasania]MCR8923580.1 DsbA family oxidoreductase [Dasania sp. GY-MA-18]MCZ0866014.1 DsbA family oxidoreductase [Dasania phycosphaerae]MCZ0869738.1 DsbA family oxidoreductase [Dasania phycosphaerae]
MSAIKIEVIHDIVCSWCPIGYANLQRALRKLAITADIYFLPYELNPDMGAMGEEIDAHLERRYQWNELTRQRYRNHLLTAAKLAGVCIDFTKRSHYYNSNKAHYLLHWCESHSKQQAMNELLIDAYFKHGLDISNTQVLLDLAESLDLDRPQAEQALSSNEIQQQLLIKKQRVQQFELSSVPAFIFNEHSLVSGSNSADYFEQTILDLTTNNTI